MSKWFSTNKGKAGKGKTATDYLPDADEIERSPVPGWAQSTLRVLLLGVVSFAI